MGSGACTSTSSGPQCPTRRISGQAPPSGAATIRCRSAKAACTARCGNCSSVWGVPKATRSSDGERCRTTPPNSCTCSTMVCCQAAVTRQGASPRASGSVGPGHVSSMASTATGLCSHVPSLATVRAGGWAADGVCRGEGARGDASARGRGSASGRASTAATNR